jgi:beta-galactosidase
LVLDENRLMGTNYQMTEDLKGMILRDRNHPSVISWSIGNEEWGIENSITGARIATTTQAYAKSLDPTRTTTAGISGGFGSGISDVLEVMGYNYLGNGNIEAHHQRFPEQPGMGTEEGSTFATRGVYVTDAAKHYAAAYDQKPRSTFYSIEEGWNFYASRPYLAGMFIWTGFDYRGEPTPYGWPSVTSYFGMMDVCGFPKDNVFYLRSWWGQQPTLHLLPHWNWPGREGQPIEVWAYSNCNEVELFLNKKSQGRQPMPRNGHLVWKVAYAPGTLEAVGYRAGKKTLTDVVKTTGPAAALQLAADQTTLRANREDISVITVRVQDKNQQLMPTANPDITFQLSGPGKIIGVGNGDPTSLEADKFLETIQVVPIGKLQEKPAESLTPPADLTASTNDDGAWAAAFSTRPADAMPATPLPKAYVYRTSFEVPALDPAATVTFFYRSMGPEQSVYLNGKPLAEHLADSKAGAVFKLDKTLLKAGRNDLMIVATPFVKKHSWEVYNTDPGLLQIVTPAAPWHRRAFNGLAQIIVQTTQAPGNLVLTAKAPGLKPATLTLPAKATPVRPSLP